MRNFRINGRILSNQSRSQGLSGLRVEAWDRDLLFHDRLGSAITNQQGEFGISFSDSDFKDLFFDRYPDIFFKIYAGETLLKDTRKSTIWNVGLKDPNADGFYTIPDVFVDYAIEKPPTEITSVGEKGSSRSIFQATYTPRKTKAGEADAPNTRGLEKGRLIASLKPSAEEVKRLLQKNTHSQKSNEPNKLLVALSKISSALEVNEKINILKYARQFSQIDLPTLWQFADDLLTEREKNIQAGEREQKERSELAAMRKSVALAQENFKVVPVGYLHLEKMSFTPAGIERGELVYSLPLAPGEEVNIAHKEWSRTSEEFERLITDYMEDFSEEGVAEKSEFADAVNTQSQHSTAYNLSVNASGSYAGFSISSSFGYNASESSSKSQQTSRKQSHDITRKASSRVTEEHKMSFKVASASEVEDQSVRKIVNPFKDKATRIDYYQLIRKWEVNLYRYGMRLTWDLTIPEPGSGLLSKIQEIRNIKNQLEDEFEFELTLEDPAPQGKVTLTYDNFRLYASKYGASPTGLSDGVSSSIMVNKFFEPEQGKDFLDNIFSFKVEIPEGYRVHSMFGINIITDPTDKVSMVRLPASSFLILDTYGDFWDEANPCIFGNKNLEDCTFCVTQSSDIMALEVSLQINIEIKDDVLKGWKLNVFKEILDAAKAQYYENRQKLKDKLVRLEEELGAQDALSLRKKEREEIMKGVLRWMGFEDFEFFPRYLIVPSFKPNTMNVNIMGDGQLYDDTTGLVADNIDKNIMMGHGERIKFLHQAIEWENMLYFLYPYFWSDPKDWEFKKYLDHPDPQHKAFLKAGSARVVLAIRPGFEHAFLTFKDIGEIDGLPTYPYLSIGEEYRNFAQTNYPGIPPANPVRTYRPQFTYKQVKTWERMELITRLLNIYFRINRVYPNEGNWFDTLLQTFPMKDPWGRNYSYSSQTGESFELVTLGKNGLSGGSGEDTDIKSSELQTGDYPTSIYEYPKQYEAWQDMMFLIDLLEIFKEKNGRYPNTKEGLPELNDLLINQDEWGNEFAYGYPGNFGEFDLASLGADGKPGGEGEDADITSWAEATLIGQWYEYTPTSAMDIAFDEKMPTE